jgi:hypothetical protein
MVATVQLVPTGNPANPWNISNGNPHLAKNSGAHVITFTIVNNNTGRDITFGPDPMWVQMGSQKPAAKPPVGADQGQIGAWKVLDNGHQLVVVDWNDVPGQLHYKLNFAGYPSTDPIIENGGGIKPSYTNYLAEYGTLILVAAVSLLVGGFLHKLLFARRRNTSTTPTETVKPT